MLATYPDATGRKVAPDASPMLPARAVMNRYGIVNRTLDRWLENESLNFPQPLIINRGAISVFLSSKPGNASRPREGPLERWPDTKKPAEGWLPGGLRNFIRLSKLERPEATPRHIPTQAAKPRERETALAAAFARAVERRGRS